MTVSIIDALLALLTLGALGVVAFIGMRYGALRATLQATERDLLAARSAMEQATEAALRDRSESADLRAQLARAEANAAAASRQLADDRERLTAMKGEVEAVINAATRAALNERATQLETQFGERRKEVDALIMPLGDQLRTLSAHVLDLESKRSASTSALDARLEEMLKRADAMSSATATLATTLSGSASSRGRWGELHLENVLERSGMSKHCDLDTQETFRDLDGGARPDVLVRVPRANQRIPIDAKAPDADYRAHLEAPSEAERKAALLRHVRAIDGRVRELAERRYGRFAGVSEFTIMYLPNEGMLAAALAEDPELWERAHKRNIYLASPLTLLIMLRAYAGGWAIVEQEENAKTIALSAHKLYQKLATFADKLAKVGRALGTAVNAYNDSLGTFERGVVVHARRMDELGVFTTEEERRLVEAMDPLDVSVRQAKLPGVELTLAIPLEAPRAS